MEIEVKLKLANATAHQKLLSLLSAYKIATHFQTNTFFDGSARELSSSRAILRIRFYENTEIPKCFISLKAKAVIINGVSTVEEDEEEIAPEIGYKCVENVENLVELGGVSRVVKRVKEEFGVEGFVGLGGFRNVRNVFDWEGVKLEVDESVFEFGTCYEVECESVEAEKVKGRIERLLMENGVEYEYSNKSNYLGNHWLTQIILGQLGQFHYLTMKYKACPRLMICPHSGEQTVCPTPSFHHKPLLLPHPRSNLASNNL
ncbi:hypothetical protein Leryth_019058 [Lithospermum erythrorhizon]|nr:hypothetical protein Leryth_019058 [Lithospermum erythrorhizon]